MDPAVVERAKEAAWASRMSLSAWVELAIVTYLEEHPPPPPPAAD